MRAVKSIWAALQCCLNWKVVSVAGAIVGAFLVLAPGSAASVIPVAIALVCPISMGIMMRRMRAAGRMTPTSDSDAEIQALSDEIARLRSTAGPTWAGEDSAATLRPLQSTSPEAGSLISSATN